jgi:RNA-directed DNA polymerase
MVFWKQWKLIGTKQANLVKLGVAKSKAWEYANTRKGYWHIAKSWILSTSVTNERLRGSGYLSLTDCYLDARKLN